MKRNSLTAIMLSISILGSALAENPKLHDSLSRLEPGKDVDVIVRFRVTPTDADLSYYSKYGRHNAELSTIRSSAMTVKSDRLAVLAEDPNVEYIAPDSPVHATTFTGGPDYGWMTALDITNNFGTAAYDGTGVGVAILDSGLRAAQDQLQNSAGTASRILYLGNFVTTQNQKTTNDLYGHGTHVAGIIGSDGSRSIGANFTYWIRGIAPNANLISLRVLDSTGSGQDSWVISAIQTAIQLKSQYNIRVMNLSLGRPVTGPCAQDPLCQAIQQAWNAGIVVVVAAGNDGRNNSAGTKGYGTISAPGNSPYAITVGAVNGVGTLSRADDKITSYFPT